MSSAVDSAAYEVGQTRRLLTIGESAEALGLSPRSVQRRVAEGDLPVVRIGRSVRVAPPDLDDFVRRHRKAARNDEGRR